MPLQYYSEKNLPFGFETEINGTGMYKNGTEYKYTEPYNLTVTPNTPYTILFDFKSFEDGAEMPH